MARRLELLQWARENDAFLVEDDYTSEFRYSGPPLASLQGLDDDERVIYVGTLNKALFPGLRMGYAVVPHALMLAFASVRYLMDRQSPTVLQTVVAEFPAARPFLGSYPSGATDLSRTAGRTGSDVDAASGGTLGDCRTGPRHASGRLSQSDGFGHRDRDRRQPCRNSGACDQPILSGRTTSSRADAWLQRFPATGNRACRRPFGQGCDRRAGGGIAAQLGRGELPPPILRRAATGATFPPVGPPMRAVHPTSLLGPRVSLSVSCLLCFRAAPPLAGYFERRICEDHRGIDLTLGHGPIGLQQRGLLLGGYQLEPMLPVLQHRSGTPRRAFSRA
jgi:hypothetical protein